MSDNVGTKYKDKPEEREAFWASTIYDHWYAPRHVDVTDEQRDDWDSLTVDEILSLVENVAEKLNKGNRHCPQWHETCAGDVEDAIMNIVEEGY